MRRCGAAPAARSDAAKVASASPGNSARAPLPSSPSAPRRLRFFDMVDLDMAPKEAAPGRGGTRPAHRHSRARQLGQNAVRRPDPGARPRPPFTFGAAMPVQFKDLQDKTKYKKLLKDELTGVK